MSVIIEFISSSVFWILLLSGFLVGAFSMGVYESMREKYSAAYISLSGLLWLVGSIIMIINVYRFYQDIGWKWALIGFMIYWSGRPLGKLTWIMSHSSNIILRILVCIVLIVLQLYLTD